MRFSPILLAALTASAAIGFSRPATAQTTDAAMPHAEATAEPREQSSDLTESRPSHVGEAVNEAIVVPTVIAPESSGTERLAQASPDPAIPAVPLTDDESNPGTPPQGTPGPGGESDEIQLNITPEPSGGVEIEPAPQIAPVPATPFQTAPTPPSTTPTPTPAPTTEQPAPEPRVLVAEVAVSGTEDANLQNVVYSAIRTQPGQTTTRSQLQEDINAIFATGFFSNVRAVPEDTPLGVRVTFVVDQNPVLRQVQVQGAQVLPQNVVNDIFAEQVGNILNFRRFQTGVEALNEWYQDNGFVLAQVVDAPQVASDGTVTLTVAEGVIEDIEVRYLNRDGEATDEEGNPIRGRTRTFIITREFESQSGDVFNQQQIQSDLQRVFGLGIFEDVRVSLNPGQDPRTVDVIVNVVERNTGTIAAGAGFSSASGLFGTLSYQEQNLGGNNQRLAAEFQLGEREYLFDVSFTDPWIAGDPNRTSYTVNAFNRSSISLIFDGGEREVRLPDEDDPTSIDEGDRPRVNRLGGGVTFSRPLDGGWRASLGAQYQRVSIRDSDADLSPEDALGNELSFSGTGIDDIFSVQFSAARDRRNSATTPTSGSLLRFSTEQSLPIGQGNILFNRVRGSYSYYVPVSFTNFNEGPETLAFNVQAGAVIGDLPPYEAFSLGGTDSVRGYDSGDLGTGRSFVQATVEYRFPIFSIVGGALFVDLGTDLGTGDNVPGDPAGVRDKPGSGFGYGLGVRVQSPLGPIRVDYAINDEGDSRIHFGFGERF